jgi:hypothetical protein
VEKTNLFYFVFLSLEFSNFYVFLFLELFLHEPAMLLRYMHRFYLYGISLHVLEENTHTHTHKHTHTHMNDYAPNIDVIHILLFKFDSLLF